MFSCQFYRTFNLIFNFPFRNGKYFNANLKLIMYIKLSIVFLGFFFAYIDSIKTITQSGDCSCIRGV